jgi:hypothetical protein
MIQSSFVSQIGGIARVTQQAGGPVAHVVGHAADPRADDRCSARKCFESDLSKGLGETIGNIRAVSWLA